MTLLLNLLSVIFSFCITVVAIPPVLRVARQKNLFDFIDERKVHTDAIPPLGGIAIFLGFLLSTTIFTYDYSFSIFKYIISAVILIFFIGLKDDLITISPRKKILVEIFAAIILIVLGNIRITYGHGFFGFYHLSYPFSFAITLFIILSIINAFNFIDGIDGLAAGLGIIASFFFGTWFLLAGHIQLSVMSFSLTGSLGGFFLFNVFGNKNKLFMGDTGSLITGLIISILLIKFNELNIDKTLPYSVSAAPVISFSIVIIPLIDTLRVIIIRLSNNRSPFFPDKNHIHHKLLGILNNHFYVTVILVSANILMILLSVLFNHIFINVTFQFIAIFLLGVSFSLIPSHILRKRQNLNREISTFKTKQYKNFITEEI